MGLSQLRIRDFRCLADVGVELHPTENYFIGPNGAGKTSLLEAAFFLGRGRSFRTHRAGRLVREGTEAFEVVGHAGWAGHDVVLGVRGTAKGVEARVGGAGAPTLAALAERLPVQVIDPEVHKLVEEGPGHRRRFVDWGAFHVKQGFLTAWRKYRRALKQRNAALRQNQPPAVVASWDAELSDAARRVTDMRREYIESLSQPAAEIAQELLGEPAELSYLPGWPQDSTFEEALSSSLARDREKGATQPGPHRADLKIRLGGRLARDRVSRGQQKMLAAALILAQLEMLQAATEAPGVLLLDDPAAELDRKGLGRLLERISGMRVQRLITGLDERGLLPQQGAARFRVAGGEVSEMV